MTKEVLYMSSFCPEKGMAGGGSTGAVARIQAVAYLKERSESITWIYMRVRILRSPYVFCSASDPLGGLFLADRAKNRCNKSIKHIDMGSAL
jgi:hypothetical protein